MNGLKRVDDSDERLASWRDLFRVPLVPFFPFEWLNPYKVRVLPPWVEKIVQSWKKSSTPPPPPSTWDRVRSFIANNLVYNRKLPGLVPMGLGFGLLSGLIGAPKQKMIPYATLGAGAGLLLYALWSKQIDKILSGAGLYKGLASLAKRIAPPVNSNVSILPWL